jgi:ribosomal protein L22
MSAEDDVDPETEPETPTDGETSAEETLTGKAAAEEAPAAKTPRRKRRAKAPAEDVVAADAAETGAVGAQDAEKEAADGGDDAGAKKPSARKPAASKKADPAREPAVAKGAAGSGKRRAARLGRGTKKGPSRRVVRAHARYVRTSARKARMVCGHLRGKTVGEARAILAFTPRDVARDWSKLLESAVANAESNHELLEDDLIVREAYADEGPTIKRFRPRAMGRATPIRKRTSHLTITLTPGSPRTTNK